MSGQLIESPITSSNGAAYADFDNDGDLDIVVNNSDDRSFIYQNNSMEKHLGNYLKIKLIGPKGNTDGIGSKVSVYAKDGLQLKEQYLTRGFQSSIDRVLHFGLGKNIEVDSLKIIWPDGQQQLLYNVTSNATLKLDYSEAIIEKHYVVKKERKLFVTVADGEVPYKHIENTFDDFERERLLPHRMSQHGPALAVSDVNGDGLDDFYVGGSLNYPGALFVQTDSGTFQKSQDRLWEQEKEYEDVSAVFFDADQDGDSDLYVASGGNERKIGSPYYQDRLYLNMGQGKFVKSIDVLPTLFISSSCVKTADYDNDGDIDLFVGGRQMPGKYPFAVNSYLLRNDGTSNSPLFVDVTTNLAPGLMDLGMVTDAVWEDVDADGMQDLMVVGEWMPITIFINTSNGFVDTTEKMGLTNSAGWWYSIKTADFDNDGDMDFVAGNLGLNYKYKTTKEEPFEIYTHDFDDNGTFDIVLGYYDSGKLVPVRGRECSSQQMPFIKEKFKTYDAFGKANFTEIFGNSNLEKSLHYSASTFATTYFEHKDGKFIPHELPIMSQFSSTNAIMIEDFDNDNNLDMLLAGNLYGSEVETPRNDAGYGVFLKGDGKGGFVPMMPHESGLMIRGEVKHASKITMANKENTIVFAKNSLPLQFVKINSKIQIKN